MPVNQLDVRLSKILRASKSCIRRSFDLYNLLNSSAVLQLRQQHGPTWLQPTQILLARLLKFGVRVDF